MLFITNPRLRKLEAFMQEVPNFPPKGNKVDLDSLEDEILLFEIENVIINVKPPNENLNIRKDNIMKFRNEKHRSTFLNEAKKQSLKNYKIIAALYLLTADENLWDTAKSSVGKDDIVFNNIHLKNGSENAYALYCAAKDLYNGSRHLSIDDIADDSIIKNKVFSLICNSNCCVDFTLENGEYLDYDEEQALTRLKEKIEEIAPFPSDNQEQTLQNLSM